MGMTGSAPLSLLRKNRRGNKPAKQEQKIDLKVDPLAAIGDVIDEFLTTMPMQIENDLLEDMPDLDMVD